MAIPSISGKRAARASAEDSSAFGPIAERFRRAGELERAVSLCRDGLQRFPDQVSARVTLGWALLELGKFDEAREELAQVLRRRPDNLAAIRALAELHDRSEQTLNLPMDGPGQWPPSDEVVDQAATNVADPVLSDGIEEPVLVHPPSPQSADIVAATPLRDAALIAPPALGLAMWSAMPEPEPEAGPEPSFGFMLNDRTAALAAAAAAPVQETHLPEVDLAALIAEADSLDAAADEDVADSLIDPPMMLLEATEIEPAAVLNAEPVFAVPDARTFAAYAEGASEAESEPAAHGPAVFQFLSTPVVATPFAQPEELTAGVIEPELVVAPLAERVTESDAHFVAPSFVAFDATPLESSPSEDDVREELVAFAPAEELVATAPVEEVMAFASVESIDSAPAVEVPAGPRFDLEAQSILAIESAPIVVVGDAIMDAAALELGQISVDQGALDFERVEAGSVLRSEVLEFPEPLVPVAASPVRALEGFLARVQARRQHLMAESVA